MKNVFLGILFVISYILIVGYTLFFYNYRLVGLLTALILIVGMITALMIEDKPFYYSLFTGKLLTISGLGLVVIGLSGKNPVIVKYDKYINSDIKKEYFIEKAKEFLGQNPDYESSTRENFKIRSKEILALMSDKKKKVKLGNKTTEAYRFYFDYRALIKKEKIDYIRRLDD